VPINRNHHVESILIDYTIDSIKAHITETESDTSPTALWENENAVFLSDNSRQ